MNDISIGAVGAAVIAGLVSLLGLIIGKEQKVSEFRQVWINDLRSALISYLVHINAISDSLSLKAAKKPYDNDVLLESYKRLNEASHGISFRINPEEMPAKNLLGAMSEFEALSQRNEDLTPEKIKQAEAKFVSATQVLLKKEWVRVRTGEPTYVVARWVTLAATALMIFLLVWLWLGRGGRETQAATSDAIGTGAEQTVVVSVNCPSPACRTRREAAGTPAAGRRDLTRR